jgi:hypothetical protein
MADETTKMKDTNFIRQETGSEFAAGQNAPNARDTEGDDLDEELKSIFDDLRLVGSPQEYSLDEVLVKAIRAEKESLENKVKTSGGKPPFGAFGKDMKSGAKQAFKIWEGELQFQAATMLLLALGSICLVYILPLKGQEVTENFREIQVQVIK